MTILYGTDGSAAATAAAALLARLSLSDADTIVVLHAGGREGGAAQALADAQQALAGTRAIVRTETRAGAAADQILAAARECGADLVALGATGANALSRLLMGSVTDRVLRQSECPVLVARPVRHDLRKVLVAVDASSHAERVVAAAARLPLPVAAELRLATVLPPQESLAAAAPTVWAALGEELEANLHAAVRDAEDRLRAHARVFQAGEHPVAAEVLRGDPATSLIAAADQERVDLLVLGSHGEGGVDRFVLGSVSERVARHAHCSVLVVR